MLASGLVCQLGTGYGRASRLPSRLSNPAAGALDSICDVAARWDQSKEVWQCARKQLLVAAVLITAFSASCSEQQHYTKTAHASRRTAARPRIVKSTAHSQPTDQECLTFAQSLVQAIESGDRARVNALIDWDHVIEQATAGSELAEPQLKGARSGFRKSMDKDTGLAAQWISNMSQGRRFKPLRSTNSGRATVLLRIAPSISASRRPYLLQACRPTPP